MSDVALCMPESMYLGTWAANKVKKEKAKPDNTMKYQDDQMLSVVRQYSSHLVLISPYNSSTLSSRRVMRINGSSIRDWLDVSLNSQNWLQKKCTAINKENWYFSTISNGLDFGNVEIESVNNTEKYTVEQQKVVVR